MNYYKFELTKFSADEFAKYIPNWVKALRSGKYKQTTGVLKSNKGYCCLGVLCEIENIPSFKLNSTPSTIWFGEEYKNCSDVILPIGPRFFPDSDPRVFVKENNDAGQTIGITAINDRYGFDFNAIADLLEGPVYCTKDSFMDNLEFITKEQYEEGTKSQAQS